LRAEIEEVEAWYFSRRVFGALGGGRHWIGSCIYCTASAPLLMEFGNAGWRAGWPSCGRLA
jgi:hypothetical protein